MAVTWHYPSREWKRAPRSFRCNCGRMVERGSTYARLGHGRYCIFCSNEFKTK